MSLGNPVFTVFQSKNSRHVFFVRYKDGTIDVLTAKDIKESFSDIDMEASGQFNTAAKAIQYADEELGIDDTSVDIFGQGDDDEDEHNDDDEDGDDIPRLHEKRYYRYGHVIEDEDEEDS